jgi:hypothetical protein
MFSLFDLLISSFFLFSFRKISNLLKSAIVFSSLITAGVFKLTDVSEALFLFKNSISFSFSSEKSGICILFKLSLMFMLFSFSAAFFASFIFSFRRISVKSRFSSFSCFFDFFFLFFLFFLSLCFLFFF